MSHATLRFLAVSVGLILTDPAVAQRLGGSCNTSVRTGDTTSCDVKIRHYFLPENNLKPLALKLTSPATSCGEVQYIISGGGDGKEIGRTPFLRPGVSGWVKLGKLDSGPQLVFVSAVGKVGGCNTGRMLEWFVDVEVATEPK